MTSEQDDGIDRDLLREMIQAPISPEEWKQRLRAHRKFRLANPSAIWGAWQVLTVGGLPMGLWMDPAEGDGEQLNLRFGNLQGLDLRLVALGCAGLVGVMAEGQCFRAATLTNSLLTDAFLDGADFSLAKMERADLSRASLRGACFKKALLVGADFENADLTGADFTGAELRDASFQGAILDGVKGR